MATGSELPIDTGASAFQMAEAIFGDGVTVVHASYDGDNQSSGIFSNGDSVAPGVTPSDTGVILSTGHAVDITQSSGDPNRSGSTTTDTSGQDDLVDFNTAVSENGNPSSVVTRDAAFIDVDFIPTGDTITLQYVFASEEYPEYANSQFNDQVIVWVNGVEAQVTVGDGSNSVGNVNQQDNENLYRDNTGDDYNTEMDGFTVTLTVKADVVSGAVNTLRIGIVDVGDSSYDSNVLIAGNSVQSSFIAQDDIGNIAPNDTKVIDVLSNDGTAGVTKTITHINGQAVGVGSTITLTTGQQVTLNADGTLTVVADGDTEAVNFSYTVSDGTNTDTALVTLNSVPCFVAGTMILTPEGERPVETLVPGDLVTTLDNGDQPLRWIGSRRVAATGDLAPIWIAANTFGEHDALLVSPQHRVMIRDVVAELLFGEPEVFVAARHLVNDRTVLRRSGGEVDYVHLLFDRHEVVYSAGLTTESFLPGPQVTDSLEKDIVDEIRAIFPELDPVTGAGYSPAARPALRAYEAQVFLSQRAA